jgi:hypothetical protein
MSLFVLSSIYGFPSVTAIPRFFTSEIVLEDPFAKHVLQEHLKYRSPHNSSFLVSMRVMTLAVSIMSRYVSKSQASTAAFAFGDLDRAAPRISDNPGSQASER